MQCGYSPGRTAFGGHFRRAAYALAAITGNVDIMGGDSGVSNGATRRAGIDSLPAGATRSSPGLDAAAGRPARAGQGGRLPGRHPGDLFGGRRSLQPGAQRRQDGALARRRGLIIAPDHFLTPTARHADIVLPATTFWERNDVHTPWAGAGHYAIYMKQAIEPMYECRNDMAIFADLAAHPGFNDYDDRTEEQWLRELTKGAVGDFEAFRENGVARFAAPKDAVAFAAQIRDPDKHKFTTPSGKIEIYSMTMAAKPDPYGLGIMPPIPTWFEPVEPDAKYPLMLCSPKSRARTHTNSAATSRCWRGSIRMMCG